MKFSKLLLSLLLTTFATTNLWADDTCIECKNKNMSGLPSIPSAGDLTAITKNMNHTFEETAVHYCMKFRHIEKNLAGNFITYDLEKAPEYSVDDYFQRNGCLLEGYGGEVRGPLLHTIIDSPLYGKDFAETVFLYYTKKRKDPSLWLKAINAKSTKGETLLDYIERKFRIDSFISPESINLANGIRNFICENGGIYSKYSDKKCP